MYRVANDLVTTRWRDPAEVADGLGVILLTWNNAAYRYDSFDFGRLEEFLRINRRELENFRERSIDSFKSSVDGKPIGETFRKTLEALRTTNKKKRSPVGAAKALHLIAPKFFPLWDDAIARGADCHWANKDASSQYVAFVDYTRRVYEALNAEYNRRSPAVAILPDAQDLAGALSQLCRYPKTLLKFIDEYNFAKHTKGWI